MAFAVTCKHCQARFLLNDDLLRRRIAGRIVTVRCRQCHSPIEVDASDLDPKSLTKPSETAEPPRAPIKTALIKPAPPRPIKSSTLIGIGAPPRPAAVPELRALSPGLLNVTTQVMPVVRPSPEAGFPEPPPPPPAGSRELDWEWDEQTPTQRAAEVPPESIDDFEELPSPESIDDFEELPLSDPPAVVEDPLPSSSGIPTLETLTSRNKPAEAPAIDDFFASMRPRDDKNTLPLFELPGNPSPLLQAPQPEPPEMPPPLSPPVQQASVRQAPMLPASAQPIRADTEPRPSADAQVPSSGRTRKHVIAPSTQSVPPAAPATRRSSLAAPILIALGLAAGFLIWKRSAAVPRATAERTEEASRPTSAADRAPSPAPPSAPNLPSEAGPTPPVGSPPSEPTAPTTPEAPARPAPAAVAARDPERLAPAAPSEPQTAKGGAKGTAAPAPEPDAPAPAESPPTKPKDEVTEPAAPSEPAGPFDRDAAAAALSAAAARAASCRKPGDPNGVANVVITFAPSGRVTSATISGPPYAGTPTGGCIASTLRQARVPAFEGERVTVSKTIAIE